MPEPVGRKNVGLVQKTKAAIEALLTGTITSHTHPGGLGSGDVVGPATNSADYLPQWNGANSKTVKNGVAIPAGGLAGLTALGDKVDKVTGSSLVIDTEIAKIHAAGSDNQTIPTALADLSEDVTHRVVTDTEKNTWNNKGSSNLILGDLAANAYYGDKGKTAYDHSQAAHAPSGAEVNVNADWNSVTGDSEIFNKPSIPAAQVQTDWNAVAGIGVLLNKPTISGSNTGDETAARIATIITGAGAQTTPLDADEFPFYKIVGTILSKVTWANIKATLGVVFQATLVSATNIKTINSNSLLGSGDLAVSATAYSPRTLSANLTIPTENFMFILKDYKITGTYKLTIAGTGILSIR